jgi:A/G-specific adenine glycosylase
MLQQTQVATVIPYYHRFLEKFPTIKSLAESERDDLMKAWEGLGYYSRVRNLQEAAQTIAKEHGGHLPQSREQLLTLKGFGAYTSASVASLAFGADCAAVDGNVLRVFSRYYAIESAIDSIATKQHITDLATKALPKGHAGKFNEAVMELGATVCTSRQPSCLECPIRKNCQAYLTNRVSEFPVKQKKAKVEHFNIAVGIVQHKERVLIALRPANGLLGNLWEFPGGKLKSAESLKECCEREIAEETGLKVQAGERIAIVKHAYTHFKITLHAFLCHYQGGKAKPKQSQEVRWVKLSELNEYAFPKANKKVIESLLEPIKMTPLSLF